MKIFPILAGIIFQSSLFLPLFPQGDVADGRNTKRG